MAKTYKQIVKSKKLKELFYQITFFAKKVWMNSVKPLVLAAGTSAGKTFTTIIQLEIFYSIPQNAKKITLIFAASKTVLRDNFLNALEEFNPSFSYYVVTNKKELEEAIRDGYQVIVCLPQTLQKNYKMMPKVTNFILDEAHQWYFKPTIQKILKHIKPTRQLLLTGTPSRFIAKGNDFEFFFVPVMDLYENGLVSNVRFEVVSSTYDFKQSDYRGTYGTLKQNKTNSPTKTIQALKAVCDEMILKLRSKLGNKYLSNVRGANKIASMFNDLDKTIIFCHSVKQANAIHKELSEMKGLKDKVLISHSENDTDSELFEEFRTKDEYVVLVAVDRGRLGYNLPDLFNVVDFTMTQSLDMILQMMGRLLRLSNKKTDKIYYKVATKNTSGYFVDLMTAALCLFKMKWYSKFNGRNMGGIQIPKVLTSKPKVKGKQSSSSSQKKSTTQQLRSLEELGIPTDLNLFNNVALYTQKDKFSTVAWTTLDEVRREFFKIDNGFKKDFISSNEAMKIVHTFGLNSLSEWQNFTKSNKMPDNIPVGFKGYYKKSEGIDISVGEWLGTGTIAPQNKKFISYNECCKWFQKNKITSQTQWRKWMQEYERPINIPSNPEKEYKKTGEWKSWGEFCGTGSVLNGSIKYKPFNVARKFVRNLKLKSETEWRKWTKSNKKPIDIPANPMNVKAYKDKWISMGDWLGKK